MRTCLIIGVAAIALSACGPTGLRNKAGQIQAWAANGLHEEQAEREMSQWESRSAGYGGTMSQRPGEPDEAATAQTGAAATDQQPATPPPTTYVYVMPSQ